MKKVATDLIAVQLLIAGAVTFLPIAVWLCVFAFLRHWQLPDSDGTRLMWRMQVGSAVIMGLLFGFGVRNARPRLAAAAVGYLGVSLLLLTFALITQVRMLLPIDPPMAAPNQSVERTRDSRFARFESECQWRLSPVAHAGRSAAG